MLIYFTLQVQKLFFARLYRPIGQADQQVHSGHRVSHHFPDLHPHLNRLLEGTRPAQLLVHPTCGRSLRCRQSCSRSQRVPSYDHKEDYRVQVQTLLFARHGLVFLTGSLDQGTTRTHHIYMYCY